MTMSATPIPTKIFFVKILSVRVQLCGSKVTRYYYYYFFFGGGVFKLSTYNQSLQMLCWTIRQRATTTCTPCPGKKAPLKTCQN